MVSVLKQAPVVSGFEYGSGGTGVGRHSESPHKCLYRVKKSVVQTYFAVQTYLEGVRQVALGTVLGPFQH